MNVMMSMNLEKKKVISAQDIAQEGCYIDGKYRMIEGINTRFMAF
jgi:hypothetical protein